MNYGNLLICGYNVRLPPKIEPYQTQRTMIAKILFTLKNKLNVLVESPTGSGKFSFIRKLENFKPFTNH